jgi:sigma-B regulation protein RsbU (phosphoserine phosphatase)
VPSAPPRIPGVPSPRAGVALAVAMAILIVLLDLIEGPGPEYVGLLVGPPFLAAAFASHRAVMAVGGLCVGLAVAWAFLPGDGLTRTQLVRVLAIVIACCLASIVAILRDRTARHVATLSRLAAVAQQAVLRPVGPSVGNLAVAVRYVSASAEADIGGDLYEALDTPFGVRLIVGDVRGKGLEAVRLASTVLGSYRHVAHERSDLAAVVADLDRAVTRSVSYEDFVTACVVEERGGTLTVLNCGHPPPLLLRRGQVISLDPPSPAPPLGFLPVAKPRIERLEPGDRLLLYTDGLAEARRDGEFFPVRERAWRILGHGTVEDGLTSLENALSEWVQGVLDDDIALVLVEYTGTTPEPARATPAWEWDEALGS